MSTAVQSAEKGPDGSPNAGSKEELRALMLKAKNEYLSKHQDLVNEYRTIKPDANTLEIINYIQSKTESENNASPFSLNCLFILFIGFMLIITLRIQYNVYLEELLLSSLFFSLNPSIDIDLLLNDLTLKVKKCTFPNYLTDGKNKDNKKWINNNIEYCDFLGESINRKLLYIYEYSSNKYMQNNADLNTFIKWRLNNLFNLENKNKRIRAMPLNAITNKKDIEIFILSNYENLKNKWDNYLNQIETNYAKKNKIELDDVLYRLTIESIHFLFTNSLYGNYENNNEGMDIIAIGEIMNVIEKDLQYEYFRDGFICIDNKNENEVKIEFVTISDLMSDNNSIETYLASINDKKMICINTFEQIGRFNQEIKTYLKIIEKVLNNWLQIAANANINGMTVIDKNENVKQELDRFVAGNNRQYWTDYGWLEKRGMDRNQISIESLIIHNKLIYANTLLLNTTIVNYEKYITNSQVIDIKYFIKDMEAKQMKGLELFYLNNYFFHRYFFDQFKTKEISKEHWSEMSEFIGVINKQFGGVVQLTHDIIKYIDRNSVYYSAGFVWILCNNTDENNKLYFQHTLRYEANDNLNDDGILMLVDLWSHSFYNDFIGGHKLKQVEYKKINKKKYKTKEIIGQAIDIKHIGTSLQKTFNFPRTKMEMFGYYISSLFHNLDWIKIAKRWQMQCKHNQNEEEVIQQNDDTNKHLHQEL